MSKEQPAKDLRLEIAEKIWSTESGALEATKTADAILEAVADYLEGVLPKENRITKLSGNSRFDQQISDEINGWNDYRQQALEAIKKVRKGLK